MLETPDDGASLSAAVAERILASTAAATTGTAEAAFAELWEVGEAFEAPFAERLANYLAAVEEQLSSQAGFDAYVRLAESRRTFVRDMPIAENSLLFASTNVPLRQRSMTAAGLVEEA